MAAKLDTTPKSNVSNDVIASFAIEADQAQRDIDEAAGRKRAILKRAKSSGVNTKALLAAIAMKRDDEDRVTLEVRDTIRYAGIIAPHVKLTQADLFEGLNLKPLNVKTKGVVQDWEAEQKGYDNGLIGGLMADSPFAPGTEGRIHYERGFLRGQAVIAERMGENAKQADTGKTKRRGKMAAAEPEEREDPSEDNGPGLPFGAATAHAGSA